MSRKGKKDQSTLTTIIHKGAVFIGRLYDGVHLDGLILNPNHATPMHRQLYNQIRQMVLSGALIAGVRMPSSRMLSDRLGVSRFTVVTALDQLIAEGYLKPVSGSGTFVETIPALNEPELPTESVDIGEPSDILKFLSDKAKLAMGSIHQFMQHRSVSTYVIARSPPFPASYMVQTY